MVRVQFGADSDYAEIGRGKKEQGKKARYASFVCFFVFVVRMMVLTTHDSD